MVNVPGLEDAQPYYLAVVQLVPGGTSRTPNRVQYCLPSGFTIFRLAAKL